MFSIKSQKKSDGFSMIEVIVAMFILTVVGAAIMAGYTQSIRSTQAVRDHTMAINIARQGIESLKQCEIRGFTHAQWVPLANNLDGTRDVNGTIFTVNAEATQVSASLEQVQVNVTWPTSQTVTVSFATYYRR